MRYSPKRISIKLPHSAAKHSASFKGLAKSVLGHTCSAQWRERRHGRATDAKIVTQQPDAADAASLLPEQVLKKLQQLRLCIGGAQGDLEGLHKVLEEGRRLVLKHGACRR